MRAYSNLVLDLLEGFSEYDLFAIPREKNQITDTLSTLALVFKIPTFPPKKYEIKVKHRPVVPGNIKHWKVFDDDKQVEIFLLMSDEFANTNIDEECCCEEDERADACSNKDPFQNDIVGSEIIQMKNNIISKGLVSLEKLFDENDMAKNPKIIASTKDVEYYNIGTEENPNMIKLSKMFSPEVKKDYIKLMKDFPDVFVWSYDDLKVYDIKVIQHVIPLKEDHKPFKLKLRWINPLLLSLIEKEVKKMFDAKIIICLQFSKCVANLVPIRKKSGEIRLCVDLWNLNKVSLKDHYPLPKMDYILQKVVGSQKMSMLDGFSGYNQIIVHPNDR
jgi:hypothetical protein